MDLFGLNRFMDGSGSGASNKKGPGLWFQTLWDNLGGLLGGNLLAFIGFLPLALGVSLGLVYENLWITLMSGAVGGGLAGVFWAPMLSLAFQAFSGGTRGWLGRWRRAAAHAALPAAAGAVLGLLGGGLLLVGGFFGRLLGQSSGSPLLVWMVLAVDFFLLSVAAVLIFSALCVLKKGEKPEGIRILSLLFASPGRTCGAAAGTLLWFGLGVALFPVSVPFALVLGFWPPALFAAQLMLPGVTQCFQLPQWEPDGPGAARGAGPSMRQAGEIWWRRRWPAVVIAAAVIGLLLWGGNQLFTLREPDLQIAVVHAEPLPDSVRGALEDSLAALVGDQNGDGAAVAQVNDYTVVFDGSTANADAQTAGSTLLVTDIAAGVSALYLVEDKEGFLARYADKVDAEDPAIWGDCPVLAGLDAGTYSTLEDIETDLPGQALLASLTVLPGLSSGDGVLEILLERGK